MSDEKTSHVEAVLAFVHDTKPFKTMDTEEKLAWCHRVSAVLDASTNQQFGEWSQRGLAPVLGIGRSTLTMRLAWSEQLLEAEGDHSDGYRSRTDEQRAAEKRAAALNFFNDPTVVGERKAEVLAEALSDGYVAEWVVEQIASDPMLSAKYERLSKSSETSRSAPLDIDGWRDWSASEQEKFDKKTVNSARQVQTALSLKRQGYVTSGEAEMLLALIDKGDLFDEIEAHLARKA